MIWTDSALESLAHVLAARTGLTFDSGRRAGAEVGIRRAMARAKVSDPRRYLDLVRTEEALFDDLLGELTVGETYFFREPAQFAFLCDVVLPEILRRRGDAHTIRAWSAGCASGEEAYSLAMLFAREGLTDRAQLLATDLSRAAIDKARRATSSAWSLRGDGVALARPYLSRVGDRFLVEAKLRSRVAFEIQNLALDLYPSFVSGTWGMDLILCRNVLIYFDRTTIRDVASRLHASLAEGGWLIVASSDPPLAEYAPFESVVTDRGVFYRRRGEPLVPLPANEKDSRMSSRGAAHLAGASTSIGPIEPDSPSPRLAFAALAKNGRIEGPGSRPAKEEVLAAARADLSRGDYSRAAERTRDLSEDPVASALRVRALANLDPDLAERASAEAAARHPLSSEIQYLRALLLLGLGRDGEAERAARRVVYLDRSLAIGHFLLGSILQRHGAGKAAWRSYRNARDLCEGRPADEVVPLSDDEPAGRLAEAARARMDRLEPAGEAHR